MRIAIANAPTTIVDSLRQVLSRAPHYDLAWIVKNSAEAVRKCAEDRPDLLLMGLLLPVAEVVDSTLAIMQKTPCPILIVTEDFDRQISGVFDLMVAGALDVVNVPVSGSGEGVRELLRKIETTYKHTAFRLGKSTSSSVLSTGTALPPLVVIGASTGGPNALVAILSALPKDFPAAILVVQHVDEQFADGVAQWLGKNCQLPVNIARSGDKPLAGQVLLASSNNHMVLTANRTIAYRTEPEDYPYRPSVDVFFGSVALHWREPSIAVLLTGMGRDGALGLKALLNAGWHTIAQNKESCAVYGMPKAAIEMSAAKRILSPPDIAKELLVHLKSQATINAKG